MERVITSIQQVYTPAANEFTRLFNPIIAPALATPSQRCILSGVQAYGFHDGTQTT